MGLNNVWMWSVAAVRGADGCYCDGAAGAAVPLQACRGQQSALLPRVCQQKELTM